MYPPGTGDGKETTQGGNCTIRYPPHHGGTPGEARPKRVAQTALWSCRTVATGGRTAMRQRPPRAGTFALGSRTKLSRKWGSGGVATMGRPHPYQNGCDLSIGANPRRFFGGFLIAQKATRRRGGEIPLKSNGAVQNRREGQAPPLRGNVPHMSRNGWVWDPPLRWGKGCGAPTGVRAHGARPSPILKETPGPPNGRPGGLDHDVFTFRRGRPRRRP